MNYIVEIKSILANARQKAYTSINTAMIEAYWLIGKRIVDEEQGGKDRAEFGKEIIKNISLEHTQEFGKGFSERTIREIMQFYLAFPVFLNIQLPNKNDLSNQRTVSAKSENQIWRSLFAKLSWSHFQRVLKVSDE